MSILDRVAERLGELQKELLRDRHPYLMQEPAGFGRKWVLKQKGFGCRPVKAQAAISMVKNPPPLPASTSSPASVGSAAAGAKSATAVAHAPPPASTSPPAARSPSDANQEQDCPQPPPFDMLDIPDGMDAMGFSYAAHCARRWFNGPAHVIPDGSNAPLGQAFVDDGSCKMKWVRKFGNVQARYERLLASNLKPTEKENIYNGAAQLVLLDKLRQFLTPPNHLFSGTLDTLPACGHDLQLLHQRFQFQRVGVSMPDVLGSYTTVMNDLAASLANFDLYAAIATARISTLRYNRYDTEPWKRCVHAKVEITHVYVYVKDAYSFNDHPGSAVSQYLGHWNRAGVIITVDAALAEQISKFSKLLEHERDNVPRWYVPPLQEQLDRPVDTKSSLRKADVFYPVRNRDFQNWRNLKGRGGDFVIYSDLERIRLTKPITLDLGETCWEFTK